MLVYKQTPSIPAHSSSNGKQKEHAYDERLTPPPPPQKNDWQTSTASETQKNMVHIYDYAVWSTASKWQGYVQLNKGRRSRAETHKHKTKRREKLNRVVRAIIAQRWFTCSHHHRDNKKTSDEGQAATFKHINLFQVIARLMIALPNKQLYVGPTSLFQRAMKRSNMNVVYCTTMLGRLVQ